MKKQFFAASFALTVIAALSTTSCTKLAKNLQYDLDMQTATVDIVIPPFEDTTANISGTQTNNYNIDSFIKANTANVLGINNISSAKLRSCKLIITPSASTAVNNFANFKYVNASFYTNANTKPLVMNLPNNPDVTNLELTLPVDTSAELKSYLNGGNQFTYAVSGALRRPITDSIHCRATVTFKVHVQG